VQVREQRPGQSHQRYENGRQQSLVGLGGFRTNLPYNYDRFAHYIYDSFEWFSDKLYWPYNGTDSATYNLKAERALFGELGAIGHPTVRSTPSEKRGCAPLIETSLVCCSDWRRSTFAAEITPLDSPCSGTREGANAAARLPDFGTKKVVILRMDRHI
jgi:hypothetical protein